MTTAKVPEDTTSIDFVIAGAQKSASTFLQGCLSDHPQIWMPRGESPIFEDPDFSVDALKTFCATELPETNSTGIIGIKRPNYLGKPEVPPRLRTHAPDIKVVVVLRQPVDRLVSAYFHYMKDGFIPVLDPNEGLRALLEDPSYVAAYPRAHELIQFSRYGSCLERFDDFRDRGVLALYLHEDVAKHPSTVVREVYNFLRVDTSFHSSALQRHPQRVSYDLRRVRLRAARSGLKYEYYEEGTRLRPARLSLLDRVHVSMLGAADAALSVLDRRARPVIDRALRKSLTSMFEEDVAAVERRLGRRLTEWYL